jgi:predicted extracellular nuclease
MSRRLLPALIAAAALAAPANAAAVSDTIVISEVQLRGADGGNDEFVELRNVSSAPVAIGGWALQGCAGASGAPSTRATVPAGTTVPAGAAYLFVNDAGSLRSGADQGYGTGFADDGGVRIVNGGTVVDGVANQDASADQCREGTGLSFPTTNGPANAFERTQDTDDNAADFDGPKAPDPQNSGGDVEEPVDEPVLIHEVQGAGAASPIAGQTVTIEGVVTGVDDEIGANFERVFPGDAGIFVQEEPADADADPATSEGVFVGFVRPRSAYPPGTVVRLAGRVVEQFNETRINITQGTEPEVLGTAPVPEPVIVDPAAAAAQATPARPYYESLEGMNVRVDVGTATSGARNKFGETFLTLGVNRDPEDRVFRTEPTPDLIAADADAGAGDPDNPLVDTDSTTELEADLFDVVRGLEGPLGFSFSHYKVINQEGNAPAIEKGPTRFPYDLVHPRRADQLRIASFNVENYFPEGGDLDLRIVTREEYELKRDRIAHAIDELLERPDVVAVQEVADRTILQDLADTLGGYTAYLEDGNDSRGIDVGFLIADGVEHSNVRQFGKTATGPAGFTCSDVPGGLFDRPPLAVDVERAGVKFTLFSNHFSSKSAPDECRAAQAAFVRDRVAEIEAAGGEAIVAGDLNAFETESALTTLEDGATSLDNLWDVPPESERYSFHFDGRLQTLDHVLVTDGLQPRVEDFRYAHFDNDYYERRDTAAPDGHHVSDHDPPLLTLDLPGAPVNVALPEIVRAAPDHKPVTRNETLTADAGEWEVDEGELSFAYQWLRDGEEIAGATGETYTVGKDDKGHSISLRVTASSPGGEASAESEPVGPVPGHGPD